MAFGDAEAPRVLRPQQGRLGLLALLAQLRAADDAAAHPDAAAPGGTAGLTDARGRLTGLARARGLVVIVSDFRGPRDWEPHLRTLRARHGVLAIEIRDPRELELPAMGDVWFTDPETGRQLVVNTSRRKVRKRFAEAAAAEREEVAAALRRAGADHLVLGTDGDWLKDLAGAPAARGARPPRRDGRGRARAARPAAAHAVPAGDDEAPRRRRRRRRRAPEETSA